MEKPYFTTIVAFSTPSGRLHIGHALSQVAGDVASKYAELHEKRHFFQLLRRFNYAILF